MTPNFGRYTLTPRSGRNLFGENGRGGNDNGGGGNYPDADTNKFFKDQCPSDSRPFWYDDSSDDEEECELLYAGFDYILDRNDNPILKVKGPEGVEILISYDKSLEKYYHQDVYNLDKPAGFDGEHARRLAPKERIEYSKEVVPRDKVIEFQIETAKQKPYLLKIYNNER